MKTFNDLYKEKQERYDKENGIVTKTKAKRKPKES